MEIWGQIISLIAMMAIILSFQCKSNRNLTIVMGIGALLFGASFVLLGNYSAAIFDILAVISSVMCLKDNWKNKFNFALIAILHIVATCFTFSDWWSPVLMTAQIASAYSIMFKSGTFIRKMRFFFVSPAWLINNIVISFSVGGIVCELITMTSVIVSFIRYRKTGFEN